MAEQWYDRMLENERHNQERGDAIAKERAELKGKNLDRVSKERMLNTKIQGDRNIQADQGIINYALQYQQQAGQRQLAADQYGYNYGLQGQQIDAQQDRDHASFQHDDELFERHHAGSMAELHLQQLQQTKMAEFQAQQEQQRLTQQQDFQGQMAEYEAGQQNQRLGQQQDFSAQSQMFDAQQAQQKQLAQQTHEAALHHLALRGQEARDEILHRYDNDTLDKQHSWRAEELKQQQAAAEQQAYDTHIATGIQKGMLELPQAAQQRLDDIDSKIIDTQTSQWLSPDQRKEVIGKLQQEALQLQRMAQPKRIKSVDRNTAIDQQYGPEFRQQHPDAPIHLDPKTGMPMVDYKAWGVITTQEQHKAEQQRHQAELQAKQAKAAPKPPVWKASDTVALEKRLDTEQEEFKKTQIEKPRNLHWWEVGASDDKTGKFAPDENDIKAWRAKRKQELVQEWRDYNTPPDSKQDAGDDVTVSDPGQSSAQPAPAAQGGNAPPPAAEPLPVHISSKEQYDQAVAAGQLKPGMVWVGPDGKTRRVK